MKCPFCDNEMENGYIQSARDIFWGRKKHKLFFMNDEISIASGWNGSTKEAYACKVCQKIIIDYSDKKAE